VGERDSAGVTDRHAATQRGRRDGGGAAITFGYVPSRHNCVAGCCGNASLLYAGLRSAETRNVCGLPVRVVSDGVSLVSVARVGTRVLRVE
jgi:hypothetical protein